MTSRNVIVGFNLINRLCRDIETHLSALLSPKIKNVSPFLKGKEKRNKFSFAHKIPVLSEKT